MKITGALIIASMVGLFGFLYPWLERSDDPVLWCAGVLLTVSLGIAIVLWGDAYRRQRRRKA